MILPLSMKQIKSSKAMQEIQPKLQEIQKKYSSKDANTQQKLQQETMELFQEKWCKSTRRLFANYRTNADFNCDVPCDYAY